MFHHFTTEQGLPHDAVTCILQDKKGFLWIGTNNGLCRYDGSRFLVYKNNPADSFSISDDVTISLSLDGQDRVWIGTWRGGLNMLDEKANRFIHYKNQKNTKPLLANNFVPSVQQSAQLVESGMVAKLEQNIPNPFSNTTTINYYLPVNKGNAYINFYSSAGIMLKSIKLTAAGKGTINIKANELPSGSYQYSLVVEGKIMDPKQMILAK